MDTIKAEEVKWLWHPYIPFGKLTIIQGDPGEGKTTFALRLAAKLSRGEQLDSGELQEPMNIIYQTAEDGLADTVKPRLESAGANCERILVIDDSVQSLSMHDSRIEAAIEQTNAKLLILDPIQAFLGDKVDMNRANETRDATKKLTVVAERTGCAIILIGHMNKGSGGKAAYRGIGSIDFFAVARSVLLVARVPGQPCIRAVAQIKSNLGIEGSTMAFQLSEDGFEWLGEYEVSVDELLGGYCVGSKRQQAEDFLKSELSNKQAVPSNVIVEKGKKLGISKRTLETVKQEMRVKSYKIGATWTWSMV